ncbi:hypothetical protein COT47_05050, partial [Candidatus Woesearchaeota archaeon CG08_land_8_20_14_0_20_43_7]
AKKKAHETALGSFGRFIDVCFMDESIMPSLGSMDDDSTLSRYIKWVKKNQLDTIEKRAVTPSPSSKPLESPASMMSNLQSILREYRMKQVNILVDNSETKGKPVIIPEKYSLEDLFGYYNDESSFNIFAKENPEKDHTKYVAGEFHKADGGYLVLDTMKLLRSMSFSKVLDVLEKGRLDIPERRWFFGRENSMTEEVSIDTRVVLYGSTHLWYALNFYVSDFKRFFKSSAQFVTRERIDTALHEVAANIYSYAKKTDGILPLDMSALEAILEEGIRESGNQQKIIVKSDMYHDLVRLSDIQAKKDDAKAIQRKHVSEVINQSRYLNGTISDLIDDAIIEGTIMTEFDGEKKGQVNGLYVSGFVEMYGKPGRITARVAVGGKGIHSIDQDIGKTGPSFKKSIATLSSILSGIVSDEKELALKLSASISFEQSYNGLDGDSATIAQLVALISAISGVEVKQSIAVTGSADQYGNAQAIGGVNYKVEGFYELCRKKGEHYGKGGEYGVVIPRSNVKHLQLREELVEDKDNFRIYAVDTIQQACEVLMGKEWNYIQEKLFDGAQRYFDASKENDVKETLAVETGGRPDDTDDLEALLHDPVALSDLADKYGIQKEMTVDGNSLAMDPGVRLAMAYAIHADAMENVKGFLKP